MNETQAPAGFTEALEREATAFGSARTRAALLCLTGAVIALLTCGFAAIWLDQRWGLSASEENALKVMLVVALASLFVGSALAVLGLTRGEGPTSDLSAQLPALDDSSDHDASHRVLFAAVEDSRKRVLSAVTPVRWGAALILLGLLAVVAQGMIFALAASADQEDSSVKPPAENASPKVDRQVLANAPVVLLHRAERYGPLDPAMFLANSALKWRRPGRDPTILPRRQVEGARIGAKCAEAKSGCAAYGPFMPFHLTRPHRPRARGVVKLGNGPLRLPPTRGMYLEEPDLLHRGQLIAEPDVPIFFHDKRLDDGSLEAVTYWLFFGFAKPWRPKSAPGHEGDWERLTIRFAKGQPTMLETAHLESPWAKVEKRFGHPAVYASLGSHTIAPKRATGRTPAARLCSSCPREPRGAGIVWRTWEGPNAARDVRQEPWFGYGGAWGHAGARGAESAPVGPTSFLTDR